MHVHLEGTIEPDLILKLAKRNDVALPYDTVEAVRNGYQFHDLAQFLSIFYTGMRVIRTEADFRDVTIAFLERAAAENVVYTELHFSPQSHLERGVSWASMMDGILAGAHDAHRQFGIVARPILGLQRHRTEENALETIEQALPYRENIIALGLAGAEIGNPPSRFVKAFDRAREIGWRCTCHAGEEGPSSYITEAIDVLKVDRIDHGVRSVDDPALVQRLADEQIPLTVCPYSNLRLNVVKALADIKLRRLLEAGCVVSANTDDPSYFEANLSQNILGSAEALDLSTAQVAEVIENGFRGAFCDDETKDGYLASLAKHWNGPDLRTDTG
ncbi:adenosine deaminase [Mesorhizobium sp. SB112]|uniref:adenosine deaminase n=1 Tax=Mesorhizobium sp. SB112 TaxID=3151853 RepID=UPI00326751A5